MRNRILVVDYEKKSMEEFRSFFPEEDFQLDSAVDGMQALDLCAKNKPDIVFASALLPKLNGFELSKRISSGPASTRCPVVIYSGIYKAEKYRREAMEGCGAAEFLEKPFSKAQLLRLIRQLTPSIQAQEEAVLTLDETPEPAPAQSSSGDPLEVDSLFEARLQCRVETAGQDQAVPGPDVLRTTTEPIPAFPAAAPLSESDLELEIPEIPPVPAERDFSGTRAAGLRATTPEVLELEPDIYSSLPTPRRAEESNRAAAEPGIDGSAPLQIDLGESMAPEDVYIDRMPELELESLVAEVRSLESHPAESPTTTEAEAAIAPPASPGSGEAWAPHFVTLSLPASSASRRVWFIIAGLLLLLIVGVGLYLYLYP
jgi:DNA-binding response OmpR family regulator